MNSQMYNIILQSGRARREDASHYLMYYLEGINKENLRENGNGNEQTLYIKS
jgi:hypothetical protein